MKYNFITLLLILITTTTYCQIESKTENYFDRTWFSFNTGLSDAENDSWGGALFYTLALNMSSKNTNLKLKYTYNISSGLFSESLQRVYDLGMLYGLKPDFTYGNIIISGGLSLVGGYYYTTEYDASGYTDEKRNFISLGFPFELQFDWNTFTKFGIGVNLFGDINSKRSFYGAGVNINVGTLR